MSDHEADDAPRKGRSNAILTYETVEQIHLGIQKVSLEVSEVRREVARQGTVHNDHEVRIRALELTIAGSTASRGTASWLWQSVWPAVMTLVAVLSFFNHAN